MNVLYFIIFLGPFVAFDVWAAMQVWKAYRS